jgi:predicted CoA-binding protein
MLTMRSTLSDADLKQLLTDASTIAVVGASNNPEKASYGIMRKLQAVGYKVVPVNPNETEVLGERAYPSLLEIPGRVDVVNVFRRGPETPPVADDAVAIGAKLLWLQSGIVSEEAARRAEAGGVSVVMDACIGTMHAVLRVPHRSHAAAPRG